jgi:cyclopropane-fatty-acyl-phospholipid synthase
MDREQAHISFEEVESAPAGGRLTELERRLLARLLEACDNPPIRLRFWTGEQIDSGSRAPLATVRIKNRRALLRMLINPALYTGDDYSAGHTDIEGDLVGFLVSVLHGVEAIPARSALGRLVKWMNRPRENTLAGSKANIHHHYDLGNEFYRLWLDTARMQYTCAYFPSPDLTLEQGQLAKLDHVCRKLEIRPGDTVAEAGCGWGGLALHMVKHYGAAKVRAFNISEEQVKFAREQAKREGLEHRVEYVLDDYRNISGQYDKFVSVGMLEHVGVEHYTELGDVIHRVLRKDGRGLIHTIGRNQAAPMNAWIEKRIFPGAYPPTLAEMMRIFEPHQFSVLDVENLRLHYATTLQHWLDRFEANAAAIRGMYDERFVRMWRLYLAGSKASFLIGSLQLFQVVFARPEDNRIPVSREHLYR